MKRLFLSLVFLIALGCGLSAQDIDSRKLAYPVKKEKLVETLNSKRYGEDKLIPVIKRYGVDFKLTPVVERELSSAGASPRLIAAVRDHYRMMAGGVINGKAVHLALPSYPSAARPVKAEGSVTVLVTIDEQGDVIDAGALSGHPLLREAAEAAALASKFKPTILKGQKIKLAGIIVYNFIAQ